MQKAQNVIFQLITDLMCWVTFCLMIRNSEQDAVKLVLVCYEVIQEKDTTQVEG